MKTQEAVNRMMDAEIEQAEGRVTSAIGKEWIDFRRNALRPEAPYMEAMSIFFAGVISCFNLMVQSTDLPEPLYGMFLDNMECELSAFSEFMRQEQRENDTAPTA